MILTHQLTNRFNLPAINSNLCILYAYLTASFSDSVHNASINIQINNNQYIAICNINSKSYMEYTEEQCNTVIYNTINNFGCMMNAANNWVVSQEKIIMPVRLTFDNNYNNTIKHIYARCVLLYIA